MTVRNVNGMPLSKTGEPLIKDQDVHIMIDIETLGVEVTAPVVSIGACVFCLSTGKTFEQFDMQVSIESAMSFGKAEAPTVKWWLQQPMSAVQKSMFGDRGVQFVLVELRRFICDAALKAGKDGELFVWSNGAAFDIPILERLFRECGIPLPWKFRNVRCARTVIGMAKGFNVQLPESVGEHHNAIDDAIWQANAVGAVMGSVEWCMP